MAKKSITKEQPRNFEAFAMIDGSRKKVTIFAANLQEARDKFAEQYPNSTIPDLK